MKHPHRLATLCLVLSALSIRCWAAPQSSLCDLDNDGATTIADVQSIVNQALGVVKAVNYLDHDNTVNVVDTQIVVNAALKLGCSAGAGGGLSITGFSPQSGAIGTVVTLTGSGLGAVPQVSMPSQAGGTIALPLSSLTATSLSFVIPSGAASGFIGISNGSANAYTSAVFTVTPASTFNLAVLPASASLVQGQSVAYSVQLSSTNSFDGLAQLSVSGVPAGIGASFAPASISAGQTAILTLTAPANQAAGAANLSIGASATVQGLPVSQSGTAALAVVAPTTALLGRTVVSDPQQTPLAGVTISSLGQDGNGNTTLCTGFRTISDAAGNFALTNLPQACTGPQLFNFDGTTATSPPGQYAGVNLMFPMTMGQVTASPVLVHLPRIDTVETFNVTQNAAANQTYSYQTIPGLAVTVYAGTTLTLPDGTTPNPFPLAAVQVPVDRLPDAKPNVPTMVRVFIVAFQPAESTASQPVAVTFPNVSNTPVGTDMPLMTLNPLYGQMVPYGTGAVSANGMQVVPDPDPAHPGHLYGLVHFDWHGQMPPPDPNQDPPPQSCTSSECVSPCPSPDSGCEGADPSTGEPIELATGLHVIGATDIALAGTVNPISIHRVYRTLDTNDGPFGLGTQIQYAWTLDTGNPNGVSAINLIAPTNTRMLFSRQANRTLINTTVPWLQGAVMTTNTNGTTTLQFYDGTVYTFTPVSGISNLTSITDRNGNTITLTLATIKTATSRILKVTDPFGRSLTLNYDANAHVTSVADPIGRTVKYTYNNSGTLATVTNPAGGVTSFQYNAQNNVTSMTDARGVVVFQDTYDSNGHVVQQTEADGSVQNYAYTLANPMAPTSPIISTTVTDARGNQTIYRFNIQGFVTDVTDALGQTKSFVRDPGTNQILQVTGPAQCRVCGPAGRGPMSYTYDSSGNRLTSTDALGNTTTYTYAAQFNQIASATDALGHTRTYGYDNHGNMTGITDENGHTTNFAYNNLGLLTQVTDPLGNQTAIAYDAVGDPISVTDALGNVTTSVFDSASRRVLTTDPIGRQNAISYDVLNRVVSVRDGRGSTTQFSYDAIGNLLSLTDPRGNTTAFTYDAMSRVLTRTSPLGKTETSQYDLNGNLVQFTDRRGQVNTFRYDVLNRLSAENYQDGSMVTRSYDPFSRIAGVNDSAGGIFGFAYDAAGRLLSQSEPAGTVNYTRDGLGRVATRQVAGQPAVTYSYDPAGNMLGASMPAAGVTFAYDARNLPSTETRTNGVSTAYTFDSLSRVLSLIHSKGATALNTQTYSYNGAGDRTIGNNDISQPLITQAATASVDAANELLNHGPATYTYDANGNRLTETGPNGSYTYAWDSRNRLTSVVDGSGNRTSFKYDYLRNLTEIDRTAGAGQSFVFDSLTNVASLTGPSGLPVSVLTGRTLDSHFGSVDSAGNVTFGIGDPLGSTTATTGGNGSVGAELDYEPYGQTTGAAPAAFPFTYTGRIPVVGNIVYYRNRFYDSGTGRFISEDPLAFSGGDANLSRYVRSSPIALSDPLGEGGLRTAICYSITYPLDLDFGLGLLAAYDCDQFPTSLDFGPPTIIPPDYQQPLEPGVICYNDDAACNNYITSTMPPVPSLPPLPEPAPPGQTPPAPPTPAECAAANARGQCIPGCSGQ